MGVVFLAYDRERQAEVALKKIRRANPALLYRLKNEFRALAELSHPNLITYYELLTEGDDWFFTMEYVEGCDLISYVMHGGIESPESMDDSSTLMLAETLVENSLDSDYLETRTRDLGRFALSAKQLRRLGTSFQQLTHGLAALHGDKRLHRDIKPSNIVVDRDDRVVILDLGLSSSDSEWQSGEGPTIAGTLPYLPPEAGMTSPTPEGDWYAVGVMLYSLLTGEMPFGPSGSKVLEEKRERDATPPRLLVEGNPPELESLCSDLLSRDPKDRPGPAEILERLGKPEIGDPRIEVTDDDNVFVGRRHETRALEEALAASLEGETVVLSLHGDSGCGKTELVERFLNATTRSTPEALILWSRCYEQESVPFKALDGMIDRLTGAISEMTPAEAAAVLPRDVAALQRVFPVLGRLDAIRDAPERRLDRVDDQELRRRAFAALRELLARLGDRVGLVIWIDDLQWGDIDSSLLLEELLRPPDAPSFLLVTCHRREYEDTSPCLQAVGATLDRFGDAVRHVDLPIEPFSKQEATELALQLLAKDGNEDAALAEDIARESQGVAFFVHELARYAGRAQTRLGSGLLLDEMIWERVASRAPEERRLLETIAVAGRPIFHRDAFAASGVGPSGFELARELRDDHLIRSDGVNATDRVATYHDRVRECVVDHISEERLVELHRDLAIQLELGDQTDKEALAGHFRQAGILDKARRYSSAAAEEAAAALAFDRAAELYKTSLSLLAEMGTRSGAEATALRTRLADALADAGRAAEAAEEYLAAASDLSDPIELWQRAGFQYLCAGHVDRGIEVLSKVLASSGFSPSQNRLRLLLQLAWRRFQLRRRGLEFEPRTQELTPDQVNQLDVSWALGRGLGLVDSLVGASYQALHLQLALDSGDERRVARALMIEAGFMGASRPDEDGADQLLERARSLNEKLGDAYVEAMAVQQSAFLSYNRALYEQAVDGFIESEELLVEEARGVRWELTLTRTFMLNSLVFLGDLGRLRRRANDLLEDAQRRRNLQEQVNFSNFSVVVSDLAEDEPERARTRLESTMQRWSQSGFHIQHNFALQGQVFIDLYRGDGAAAWERIREAWPLIKSSRTTTFSTAKTSMYRLRGFAALAAWRSDHASNLAKVVEECARALENNSRRPVEDHASAQVMRAGLQAQKGDSGTAASQLVDAAQQFEQLDMRLFALSARHRAGELMGDESGAELTSTADVALRELGVIDPRRMVGVWCPVGTETLV